jgi:hypothetical protein
MSGLIVVVGSKRRDVDRWMHIRGRFGAIMIIGLDQRESIEALFGSVQF